MNANEKLGPKPAHAKCIADFCCRIKNCGLFDLGYNRPAYTWTNKHFSSNPTYEHLDRCLGNAEWCTTFSTTMVYHLPMMKSDHAPILAVLNSYRRKISRPFKFENWWLLEDDYENIANQSWQKSCNRPFHLKTFFLAKDLTRWRKSKPKNSYQLKAIEDQILQFQMCLPHQQNPNVQKLLIHQHEMLLAKVEAYHRQRYKKNWSDRNTNFFHQSIIKRATKNTITHFLNPYGSFSTTQDQLAHTANRYFMDIFRSKGNCRYNNDDQEWLNEADENQAL
jgi:hypothetical protein